MSDDQSSPSIRAPHQAAPVPSTPKPSSPESDAKKLPKGRLRLLIPLAVLLVLVIAAVLSLPYWKPKLLAALPWHRHAQEQAAESAPPEIQPPAQAAPPAAPPSPAPDQSQKSSEAPPATPAQADTAKPETAPSPAASNGEETSKSDAASTELQSLSADQRKLAVAVSDVASRLDKIEAAMASEGNKAHTEQVLILASAQLQEALSRSAPYEAPLAVFQAVAASDQELEPMLTLLAANARIGVKSRPALAQELRLLEPTLGTPLHQEQTGWWREALGRAKKLVSVRRNIDPAHPEAMADGPEKNLALAEADLSKDDLAGAVQEIGGLQGDPATRAEGWLRDAKARLDAEQAAEKIESILIGRLAKGNESNH